MISFVTKPFPIPMPATAWKLLGMLLAILRYKQAKRGEAQMNIPKLIGAIVAWYVLKRARQIQREFHELEAECLSAPQLPGFYTPSQLADIRTASAEQIPVVVRTGYRSHPSWKENPRWGQGAIWGTDR